MNETTRHRKAFDRYWRMGAKRSIERLHEELSHDGPAPTPRTLYEWSRQLHWQDRIAELEREARRAEDEARVARIREMGERHAKEALLLQQKGAEWLSTISADKASAEAAIRAISEGIRIERLARGEVTERTGLKNETGLEGLSDDELHHLREYAERLAAGEPPPQPT